MSNKTLRGINGTSSQFFYYEENTRYRIPFVGEVSVDPQPGTTDTLEAFEGTLQSARPPTPELLSVTLASFNASSRWVRKAREASHAGIPRNFEFLSRPQVVAKSYKNGVILVMGQLDITKGAVGSLAVDGTGTDGFKGPEFSDLAIGDMVEFADDAGANIIRAQIVDFTEDKVLLEGIGGAAVAITDNHNVKNIIVPQIKYGPFLANIQAAGGGTWAAGANVTSTMALACVELLKDPTVEIKAAA